jgi:hypothetical protein
MLKKIYWKRLCNEELPNFCALSNIVRVIKSRGWLVGKPEGKRPLRRSKHRWEHSLEWILGKRGKVWTRFIWLRKWTSTW